MAPTKRTGVAGSANGSTSVESVVETLRSVWGAVEGADVADKAKLKNEIAQTINRLRGRVEGKIGKPVAAHTDRGLFDDHPNERTRQPDLSPLPRFPEPTLRVYGKDLAEHALKHIPKLANCKSIDDIRTYLKENLRFNSEATRRRNANYLISRYFPCEVVHSDVAAFAAAVEGTQALGDALFYLTARTEKIVALVAENVVFPSLASGGVSRTKIRDFVQTQLPKSKSSNQIGASVVATYQTFGVAKAARTKLNVSVREGSLAAFAYLLHLEFPEAGMHSFEKLLDGPLHKWILWDRKWMVEQLYLCRQAGLLTKVSEIDSMRQFTTRYSLLEATPHICELAGKEKQ